MAKNNGKASEKAIADALKLFESDLFDWQRVYDATSARNHMMAQTGDFVWFLPERHGALEVKSTAHNTRLTRKAFGTSPIQLAKLRKRKAAGGLVFIAVHHTETDVWRLVPYDLIHSVLVAGRAPSIDLTAHPEVDTVESPVLLIAKILEYATLESNND